jgi:putative transposase
LDYSRPGTPTDNAFTETFNARTRQECLNPHWFISLDDARSKINRWRDEYNRERPHSRLGYLAPEEYAEKQSERTADERKLGQIFAEALAWFLGRDQYDEIPSTELD